MPRGFRVAVYNTEAEAKRGPEATMLFAAESWLPCECWCMSEIVGVQQREVWWGVTRSCGRSACVNPETGEQVLGNAVSPFGSAVMDCLCVERPPCAASAAKNGRPLTTERNVTRELLRRAGRVESRGRSKRSKPPRRGAVRQARIWKGAGVSLERARDTELAARRRTVRLLWEHGARPVDIAEQLGVDVRVIRADISRVLEEDRADARREPGRKRRRRRRGSGGKGLQAGTISDTDKKDET